MPSGFIIFTCVLEDALWKVLFTDESNIPPTAEPLSTQRSAGSQLPPQAPNPEAGVTRVPSPTPDVGGGSRRHRPHRERQFICFYLIAALGRWASPFLSRKIAF